jgi:hypothetical protein
VEFNDESASDPGKPLAHGVIPSGIPKNQYILEGQPLYTIGQDRSRLAHLAMPPHLAAVTPDDPRLNVRSGGEAPSEPVHNSHHGPVDMTVSEHRPATPSVVAPGCVLHLLPHCSGVLFDAGHQ